ncbi:MAG: 16S rRNA (guanine(527)-N(7))-methyltransferase RsmG [Clostridia bacterium]|nr:16S rRNA (guanine(527)-N(7))-methyltransferase RsmG [Clostridia bacterium]
MKDLYGIKISKLAESRLDAFYKLLCEYNRKFNLTTITDRQSFNIKHVYDSMAGAQLFPAGANVAEIGSGGGFPSIPLRILREDLTFTLFESTSKKCDFLGTVITELQLYGVEIVNMRAEDAAKDSKYREKFDVSCARAVARMNTLCEYCIPFVKTGGRFIAYKADNDEEIREAANAAHILGCTDAKITRYDLPEDMGKRVLAEYIKVKPTPPAYPRGNGKERKKPL